MTPRTVCVTVPLNMDVKTFDQQYGKTSFTRFPVMDNGEMAFGYVHKSDMYHADDAKTMREAYAPHWQCRYCAQCRAGFCFNAQGPSAHARCV